MKSSSLPKAAEALLHLAALPLFLALGWVLYAPPRHMAPLTYFGISGDPLGFIWFLNWLPYAAQHQLPFFHTGFAAAPVGTGIAWRTNVIGLGLLAAPFTTRFGAFAVYNALMLAAPGLAAWGAYLAAAELTGDAAASLAAGLVFGFSSYMLGQMLDHLNLCFVCAVPFCLWAGIAAARHGWPAWRLGLVLAVALAFEFGVSQEVFASLAMFAAITLAVAYALHPAGRPQLRRLLPGLGLGLGLSLVIVSPVIWEMLRDYADAGRTIAPAKHYSSDLLGFILPTPVDWLGGGLLQPLSNLFQGNFAEQGDYIGLPLLLLLGSVGWRRRALPPFAIAGGVALLAAILSLGPCAHVLGREASTAPWLLAFDLPFLKSMLPGRFMLYAWLAIAMLLALWLAEPGVKARRYALLGFCLIFLLPARAYDRNWTKLDVPEMLSSDAIAPGSRIIILPENQIENGLQYAAGMRFSLVAQGYPCAINPAPFSKWPLYRPIFEAKYQKYMGLVDPAMLADFLAAYGVDAVVVTGDDAAFRDGTSQSAVAAMLLQKAGWRAVRTDNDARLYRPAAPRAAPDTARIAAYMHTQRPENQQREIDYETYWVRAIRVAARLTGRDPAPFLAIYAAHAHPPLPVDGIDAKGARP